MQHKGGEELEGFSIHRTTTGKIFQLTDLEGNPLRYDDYKKQFTRKHLALLGVGQALRSEDLGIMLKRWK